MLITFFDARGIIKKEFVPSGQTITGQYYIAVIKRFMVRIRRFRLEYRTENSWCLLNYNALSHNSLVVRRFLAKNNVCVLNHSPYSPNLAPCDYSLFSKRKMKLKGCYFEDISTLQVVSRRALQAIPQTDLQQAFDSSINRYNNCIEAGGSYTE
ncbi:putative DD34D transposase [Trichonephila clavipes]|nr:putative DD34D transposase [Trichonephila clavipes]